MNGIKMEEGTIKPIITRRSSNLTDFGKTSQILNVIKLTLTLSMMFLLMYTLRSIRTVLMELRCNPEFSPRDPECTVDWYWTTTNKYENNEAWEDISNDYNTDNRLTSIESSWIRKPPTTEDVHNGGEQIKHGNNKDHERRRHGMKLLIFSLPRSGSSFLGELFNREQDVIYLYEPLHADEALSSLPFVIGQRKPSSRITKSSHRSHDENTEIVDDAVNKLDSIYECNLLQHEHLFRLLSYPELSNPHFRLMSRVLSSPPFCHGFTPANATEAEYRRSCRPIDAHVLAQICIDKKLVVVKELMHRLPVYDAVEMSRLFQMENMQSLWLVRDPRAILASMISIGWITETKTRSFHQVVERTVDRVCGMYKRFLATLGEIPPALRSNLHILRYEDLVSRPHHVITRISRLSGGLLSGQKTLDWVMQNTQGRSTGRDAKESYSVLARNASFSLTSWRLSLSLQQIELVQTKCSSAMKRLGYVSLWGGELVTNLDLPTFKDLRQLW